MATNKSIKHAKAAPKAVAKPLKPAKSAAASVRTPASAPAAASKAQPKTVRFSDKDLDAFRKELVSLRERLTGQVAQMRQESLKRDDEVNPEEDGTDAFDRLFALERAGNDQDIIFTIDEAIRAIDEGRYGVCDVCTSLIEKPRLHALPFAKNCIKCQAEAERGRGRGGPRRQIP